MTLDGAYLTDWRTALDEPVESDGDPALVFAHVSDLHGQLKPRRHVYYDNPRSRPDFEFDGPGRRCVGIRAVCECVSYEADTPAAFTELVQNVEEFWVETVQLPPCS